MTNKIFLILNAKAIFLMALIFSLLGSFAHGDLVGYHPSDSEFWSEETQVLKDGNFNKALRLADEQIRVTKKDSLDNAEAWAATGLTLQKRGFYFGATVIFGDILKNKVGTEVAQLALSGLEENVRRAPVDEDYVNGEIMNDLEFDQLPPVLQDFASFEQGMFNTLKGFEKWGQEDYKKITVDSYWDFKLKYLGALNEVALNHVDLAIEKFSGITNSTAAPEDIKSSATHNLARLVFEKGDYQKAYKTFKAVKLNPREKGLILLERAWSKYYQKDYSKALGLLAALEAPAFDTSRSPEPYILRMLMYKELCYYDAVFDVIKEFKNRFGPSLRAIYQRQDLRKDQMLVNLSVLDQRIEKWVNLLNSLKDEQRELSEAGFDDFTFYKSVKTKYDLKIKEVNDRLDWILKDKTRETANQLLDWQEQITFLDYQTKLDSLRVSKPGSELEYKSEDIPHLSFEKIYWTGNGEFWMDELEDYKVFVESRCVEKKAKADGH